MRGAFWSLRPDSALSFVCVTAETADPYRSSRAASPGPCVAVRVRDRRTYIAVILLYFGSFPASVALSLIGTWLFGDRGSWLAVLFPIFCAVQAWKLTSVRCPHCAALLARHRRNRWGRNVPFDLPNP